MYETFYGLRERPFDLTLNPTNVLLTPQHREALGNLEYGIRERVGVTVLIGEAGTGKTTLIRSAFARAEAEEPGSTDGWAYLRNPTLQRQEFLDFLATRFGLTTGASSSKLRLLDELELKLLDGFRTVLILDEAQSVPLDLLEEVRLLANIELDSQKLIPVILAGQPELGDRLNEPSLRQLKQRVSLRCMLTALSLRETAAYIVARVENAGGKPSTLFTREAVMLIHEHSAGIPRTINVICENALLTGYADEQRPVGRETIYTVCRDFDLTRPGARLRPSPRSAPTKPPQAAPEVRLDEKPSAVHADTERPWLLRRRSS